MIVWYISSLNAIDRCAVNEVVVYFVLFSPLECSSNHFGEAVPHFNRPTVTSHHVQPMHPRDEQTAIRGSGLERLLTFTQAWDTQYQVSNPSLGLSHHLVHILVHQAQSVLGGEIRSVAVWKPNRGFLERKRASTESLHQLEKRCRPTDLRDLRVRRRALRDTNHPIKAVLQDNTKLRLSKVGVALGWGPALCLDLQISCPNPLARVSPFARYLTVG